MMRHLLLLSLLAAPAAAEQANPPAADPGPVDAENEIVVTAPRIAGAVVSDVPPVVELDEQAVESYGATSIDELLTALAPQTGPGRGRGSGGPIVLLNGQRISGFAEIRDLPPEAIRRVQVLPEEVALQYGYSADQRVVNFILKDKFKAFTADAEYGGSTAGARTETEAQGTFVTIGKTGRVTLTGQYNNNSRVLENDRGIVQQSTAGDIGAFRTLLPSAETVRLNAVVNRQVVNGVSATVNLGWQRDTGKSLFGRPAATLDVPAGRPFSPLAAPLTQTFFFDPALARDTRTDALRAAMTLNGSIARWTWTLTGNYDRSITTTRTDRGIDTAVLQSDVASPTGTIDPFVPAPGSLPFLARDNARSQTDTSSAIYTMSGSPVSLPAGAVRVTVRGGFATTRLNSDALRGGTTVTARLARNEANGRATIEIPLANADRDVAAPLGKLSINANIAYRRLSDFGGLTSFGYGLNWQPTEGLTLLASAIGSDNEPGIGDLGNPVIFTPNVTTYDYVRGETVLATRVSGGNPALVKERQRDIKLTANYQPPKLKGLSVGVDYFRNRSTNPVAGFPILTPDIEAAFPGRVVRDPSGKLVSIDVRSVNYAATASDVVRVGFTFQKEFGTPAAQGGGERGPGGLGGRGRPDGGSPGGGGRGFGSGGFARQGNPDGGRWTLALYDNIRFLDQIRIRPGLPALDLLGGDATGSNGGAPRHSFDLDAGWFYKGFGIRATGSYLSGSTVTGSNAASTLEFGDLATLNVTTFLNFDSRKTLIERMPFLKGARLRLAFQNITNAIREVRDGTGAIPQGYQPGFIDPRGRFIEIDFRKRF